MNDEAKALADAGWIARLASHRFRPSSPAALPDDADYGEETQFCLPERLYLGDDAVKLRAVRSYASQLGRLARNGSHPAALDGIMDCNGYLMSFVRRTEAFVLVERADGSERCDRGSGPRRDARPRRQGPRRARSSRASRGRSPTPRARAWCSTRSSAPSMRFSTAASSGIGFCVPSMVDVDTGVVYSVANIPSWREVPLKDELERRYGVRSFINNDANAFAVGELHFGKGRGYRNLVGIVIGTGLGAGVVINGRLYSGANCGAGEIGNIAYRGSTLESWCSGTFLRRPAGWTARRFTIARAPAIASRRNCLPRWARRSATRS